MFKPLLTAVLAYAVICQAETNAPATNPPAKESAEADYTKKIVARTVDITKVLDLADTAKSNQVFATILGQYRALREWHDFNDANIKALRKTGSDEDKAALEKIDGSRRVLHEKFITALSAELSPEQVEKVKDRMTYNKVKVTYDAYVEINPGLTDAQKQHILETLKEAREEGMDGGSSEEKSAIFKKYKGRINNYLDKEGVDQNKARKEWAAKQKPQKAEGESKPAEPAAK